MPQFSSGQQRAADALARDLDQVFGARLLSLIIYPGHHGDGSVHSMAIVDSLGFRDLAACLPFAEAWHHRGAAVPLLLTSGELQRTIDIFPLEYASMMADYTVARGADPLRGVEIAVEDIRRACEVQAKSHLIHLREGFLESHAETIRVSRLIAGSAAPLRALLTNIARLTNGKAAAASLPDAELARFADERMHVPAALIHEVLATSGSGHSAIADPTHLLSRYIEAAQRIWEYVDTWQS